MQRDDRPVAEVIEELKRDALYLAVYEGKPYLETLNNAAIMSIEFADDRTSR